MDVYVSRWVMWYVCVCVHIHNLCACVHVHAPMFMCAVCMQSCICARTSELAKLSVHSDQTLSTKQTIHGDVFCFKYALSPYLVAIWEALSTMIRATAAYYSPILTGLMCTCSNKVNLSLVVVVVLFVMIRTARVLSDKISVAAMVGW